MLVLLLLLHASLAWPGVSSGAASHGRTGLPAGCPSLLPTLTHLRCLQVAGHSLSVADGMKAGGDGVFFSRRLHRVHLLGSSGLGGQGCPAYHWCVCVRFKQGTIRSTHLQLHTNDKRRLGDACGCSWRKQRQACSVCCVGGQRHHYMVVSNLVLCR